MYQLPLLSWSVSLPCHAVAWLTFSPPSGRPLRGIKQVINQSILGQNGSRLDLREAHGGRGPAAAGSSSAGATLRLSSRFLAKSQRPGITLCSMRTILLLGLRGPMTHLPKIFFIFFIFEVGGKKSENGSDSRPPYGHQGVPRDQPRL